MCGNIVQERNYVKKTLSAVKELKENSKSLANHFYQKNSTEFFCGLCSVDVMERSEFTSGYSLQLALSFVSMPLWRNILLPCVS